ncbi:MAG: ATP phosphoribosyltransferase regulatory subunit [Clostridiaceae bacterium]|nr:ATP phosphoribosyltransferase regulatory subunit [Clostridiaceae bacterium]
MKSKKVLLPEGVQDLLIDDCIYRRNIEDKLMEGFEKAGYMEVSTPTLEYYDIFTKDYLASNGEKMFKLIDSNGSILVLRPDCTVPMARMVASKMRDFVYPLKLCYVQNIFRIDEEQAGKKREFRQAGVEIFGIKSHRADVEIIITAIERLKDLGLNNFQIDIGQVKLLKGILDTLAIEEEEEEKFVYHIENKNFIALDQMVEDIEASEDTKLILRKIPRLFGAPEEVFKEVQQLPFTDVMLEAVEELKKVCSSIEAYGLGQYISVDLGMVTSLKYYNSIIFKGFTRDLGSMILSGGRYDGLMEDFGMECSATGFAFVVNKITKALKIQENIEVKRKKHILLLEGKEGNDRIPEIVKVLREEGHIVEIALLEDWEDVLEYSRRRKVDEILKVDEAGNLKVPEELGGVVYGEN